MSKCEFWIHEFRGGGLWLSIRRDFEIISSKCQNVNFGIIGPKCQNVNFGIIGPKCQNVYFGSMNSGGGVSGLESGEILKLLVQNVKMLILELFSPKI